MAYSNVSIHRKLIRISGPSMEKYVSEETEQGVRAGRAQFDDANQEVVDGINWSEVEEALNDQLPEGYKAKVVDF